MPYLLLPLNYSYIKERLLKDQFYSHKYSKITLTFSFFVTGRDIRLADTPVSVWIGICWLTGVMFVVGAGGSIIDILPV